MTAEKVKIPVGADRTVSGVVTFPDGYSGKRGIILAHGAGNDMNHPMLIFLSEGLARAGTLTLRFNFPYKEQGKGAPDRLDVLYGTWQSAFRFLADHPRYRPNDIIAAGKSMGGRIASQMLSEGKLPVTRLILLGYPLHAPGKKDKLRDAHLYNISAPVLFFAGTRDALCDIDLLRAVLPRLTCPWELEVIQGGDHSFNVPKSQKVTPEEVYGRILEKSLQWLEV